MPRITPPLTGTVGLTQLAADAKPFFNVKDPAYGAIGNGSTDDTAAIQAAINAANNASNTLGGGVVLFPDATYAITGALTCYSNVAFVALGDAIIQAIAPFTGSTLVNVSSRANVRFEGLTFDGGTSIATTALNLVTSTNGIVRNCTFRNATNSGANGVRCNGSADVTVRDCRFETLTRGVHASNNSATWAKRLTVENCYFTGMSDAAVYTTGSQSAGAATEDVSVDKCRADNFRGVGTTRAGIYFTVGSDSTTIKHRRVRVTGCTLVGRSESFTSGTGNSDFVTFYDCDDGAVETCDVSGGGDIGISVFRSSRNIIAGNKAHDNHTHGISLWESSRNSVVGNVCYNNRRNFGGGLSGIKAGILLRVSSGATEYNTVTGNVCYDNQGTKTQEYGVSIEAGVVGTVVGGNALAGNLTGELLDAGTGTQILAIEP